MTEEFWLQKCRELQEQKKEVKDCLDRMTQERMKTWEKTMLATSIIDDLQNSAGRDPKKFFDGLTAISDLLATAEADPTQTVAGLQHELNVLRKESNKIIIQLSDAEQRQKQLMVERNRLEEERSYLEQMETDAKNRIDTLKKETEDICEEKGKLIKQIGELANKDCTLQKEVEMLKKEVDSNEIALNLSRRQSSLSVASSSTTITPTNETAWFDLKFTHNLQ